MKFIRVHGVALLSVQAKRSSELCVRCQVCGLRSSVSTKSGYVSEVSVRTRLLSVSLGDDKARIKDEGSRTPEGAYCSIALLL